MNELRRQVYRDHGPEQLVAILRAHLRPHGFTAGSGGGIALTDCVIHHQDIRRPFGLRRQVPPDRLMEALDFLAPSTGASLEAERRRRPCRGHRLRPLMFGRRWQTISRDDGVRLGAAIWLITATRQQ
jgi:uncharacterized protein (TIGR03083 family)